MQELINVMCIIYLFAGILWTIVALINIDNTIYFILFSILAFCHFLFVVTVISKRNFL